MKEERAQMLIDALSFYLTEDIWYYDINKPTEEAFSLLEEIKEEFPDMRMKNSYFTDAAEMEPNINKRVRQLLNTYKPKEEEPTHNPEEDVDGSTTDT